LFQNVTDSSSPRHGAVQCAASRVRTALAEHGTDVVHRFHSLLADSGFPVDPAPDLEPTSPPPTRLAELGWMATKGTTWVLRGSTDLVPALLALAVRECLTAGK
jgi:hypothetical protein